MKNNEIKDFTSQGLVENAYSFDFPAQLMANGIINGLIKNGWNQEQAINWVHSKAYRHALDGFLANAIEQMGIDYAGKASKEYHPAEFDYDLPMGVKKSLEYHNNVMG